MPASPIGVGTSGKKAREGARSRENERAKGKEEDVEAMIFPCKALPFTENKYIIRLWIGWRTR